MASCGSSTFGLVMLADTLMLCWKLWSNWNEFWHDERSKNPEEVVRGAVENSASFQRANDEYCLSANSEKGIQNKRSPPTNGVL